MADLEKSIQKHLDYNDDVRAGGRVKALKYRTMGPGPSHR